MNKKIYKECKECGEVYEVVKLDDNGFCIDCKNVFDSQDEEDEIFVSEEEVFKVEEIDEYPVDSKFKDVMEYDK